MSGQIQLIVRDGNGNYQNIYTTPEVGQQPSVNSLPVVVASDQILNVNGTIIVSGNVTGISSNVNVTLTNNQVVVSGNVSGISSNVNVTLANNQVLVSGISSNVNVTLTNNQVVVSGNVTSTLTNNQVVVSGNVSGISSNVNVTLANNQVSLTGNVTGISSNVGVTLTNNQVVVSGNVTGISSNVGVTLTNNQVVVSGGNINVGNQVTTAPAQSNLITQALVSNTPVIASLSNYTSVKFQIGGLNADTLAIQHSLDGNNYVTATLLKQDLTTITASALTGNSYNGIYSVMNFGGYLQITRTGSADSLAFTYRGTN